MRSGSVGGYRSDILEMARREQILALALFVGILLLNGAYLLLQSGVVYGEQLSVLIEDEHQKIGVEGADS